MKKIIVVLFTVLLLVSCGYSASLQYGSPQTVKEQTISSVSIVEVTNSRAEDRGAESWEEIGTVRNGYGWEIDRVMTEDKPLDDIIKNLTEDCLSATGISPEGGSGKTMTVDVIQFWADGYSGAYGFNAEIEITVYSEDGDVLYSEKVLTEYGYFIVMKSKYEVAYTNFMNEIAKTLVGLFSSDDFVNAVQ